MKTVPLEIVTPERIVFSEEIRFLVAPGEEGELGILPEHTYLLAHLKPGNLRITDNQGHTKTIEFGSGFLEVHPHKITVFAESVIIPK